MKTAYRIDGVTTLKPSDSANNISVHFNSVYIRALPHQKNNDNNNKKLLF
jgi:hypothetical protein